MARPAALRALAAVTGLALALTVARAEADLAGHGGPVRSLAVSADGSQALTGGFDFSVMLWDLETAREAGRMLGHEAAVGAVAFLGDDRLLSAGDDGTLALWERASARLIERKPAHAAKISAIAVSPDGALLASAGWDRTVRLWRAADLAPAQPELVAPDNVNALAFTPDHLLAGGGYDAVLRLWDVQSGRELAALSGHEAGINAVLLLPGGRLATASSDRTVRLWDVAARGEAGVLLGAESAVLSLAAAPDAAWIAAGEADGFITVWDGSGKVLRRWQAHAGPAWALALAGARQALLSAGADGLVRSWPVGADGPSGTDVAAGAGPLAALATSADPGERLFAKCASCHTLTPEDGNKAGPTLYGLFGRRAGTVEGYPYSQALRDSSIVWTEQTVDRLFALGPHIVTPGSKMPLQRMADPSERAALISYLRRRTQP